ncbi:RHS repeat-associated core domain-containing protein [Weeksellaceae bacterium KMM 9713]|uniref:RHS repeat-associated core domain-containing protein n=1 Tax=Profundicola chukchiensis TaxID=2961959 RepID=A0A9X4RVR7_9FLAO|nr:RHS repeat-associated core domain-containing protein [Profundicola chukchiensis]MDG4945057.1 RHS repeat-associated core domain-containing protein [Profundicola chukchiensis]
MHYQNPANLHHGNVKPLYNGNISQTFWRTANDNKLRGYAYSYDALNRLNTAYYRKGTACSNNFNESLSYDKNGNVLSLQRWGVPEDYGTVPAIPNMDDLSYTYFPNSNKLRKVSDGVASTKGFNDGVNLSTEYIYDPNANMKEDKNKGITEINYNHLNLPTEIKFSNHQKIAYIYNALGTKIEKTVTNRSDISKTEYLDSFQYIDGELQFFPVSGGYVRKTEGNGRQQYFDYVYNYTDHLGNIRLSYTTDPQSPSNIKILEESNYYPFGLQHGSYNTPARDYCSIGDAREIETVERNPYRYKYNGKEWQDELGLDWYDHGARNYDASLGRWMNADPLTEQTGHVYSSMNNNPVNLVDPDGRAAVPPTDYVDEEGNLLLHTNDGSNDVIVVKDEMLESFTENIMSADSPGMSYIYDSEGWNETWKTKLVLGDNSEYTFSEIVQGYSSQWSRQKVINFLQNSQSGDLDLGGWSEFLFAEVVSQNLNPLNHLPSPNIRIKTFGAKTKIRIGDAPVIKPGVGEVSWNPWIQFNRETPTGTFTKKNFGGSRSDAAAAKRKAYYQWREVNSLYYD